MDSHLFSIYLHKEFKIIIIKMEKDESKIWEKFYGKKVATEKLNIEGFSKPIEFDIYDGHAICYDYKGHRYDMIYPQMKAVKDSTELSDAILEYVGDIDSVNEISVIHILIAFHTLYKDGVEVQAK